jgi:hypothetical protein
MFMSCEQRSTQNGSVCINAFNQLTRWRLEVQQLSQDALHCVKLRKMYELSKSVVHVYICV